MIETIRQGLKDDGYTVSISKLCRWFGVARRTVYYKPTKKAPTVQARFAVPIKQMIEENPSYGYRTVAHLLKINKNTVQRVFQLMHWQVRKRPVGFRPRVRALPR
jgi:putative transposase